MTIAIITGASSGVGREFAIQLKNEYSEIDEFWIIARRAERLQQLAEEMKPTNCKILVMDLSLESSYDKLQNLLINQQPQVKILLNNSGVGVLSNVIEMDVKSQINMCDVNVKALTAVTTVVLPYMVKGGTIINISSIASFAPTPKMTVYSATKAYVSAYSRGLNYELKDRGVNVLAICPGPMDTEFLSVAGITQKGSKTFDTLPHTKVEFVVRGAIKAAKKGKAFYTPKLIFKIYRVLAKLLPHALIVKFSKC